MPWPMTAGNGEIQECFYNGWMHDLYVTCVFCFCCDGTIPIAFFNVPGLVHDSQVTELEKIYQKLEQVYKTTGGSAALTQRLVTLRGITF
jgi:hypothetical protein